MAFSHAIGAMKELYLENARDAFALCYLYAGPVRQALPLLRSALEDALYLDKRREKALSGREGFLWAVQEACNEFYEKDPFGRKKYKKHKKDTGDSVTLPFFLTDSLRAVLKLHGVYRAPLYLVLAREYTPEEAARILDTSPRRVEALIQKALKKLKFSREKAAQALSVLRLEEEDAARIWQRVEEAAAQPDFEKKHRSRRIWRGLDQAVPYLALAIVVLGIAAYLGVGQGWFTGEPYTPTQPIEGVITQEGYDGDSAVSLPIETGDVSVFVPEEGGFAEYIVHNTPYSPEDILRQMVYLGGAPAGTTLLSANLDSGGTESSDGSTVTYTLGDTLSLTLEFSQEAASLSGEEGERTLQAMAATFAAYTQGLDRLSFRCQGEELTVNGKTAQDFLDGQLTITRTVETDYRE